MGDVIRKIEDIEAEMARIVNSINETERLNGCGYPVLQGRGPGKIVCTQNSILVFMSFFRLNPSFFFCQCKCIVTLFHNLDQT